MLYLVVIITLMLLSCRYDIIGKTKNKKFWYAIVYVVFVFVAGLRWRLGIDTCEYLYSFYHNDYPSLDKLTYEDFAIGNDPLFSLLNSLVFYLGGRFYVVQLIHAAFVNGLIFIYIRKHSTYIFTSVFFYAILSYTDFNMEILRGSMSVTICLFGNDFFLEKKWFKGFLLYFIALLCHVQTIVLFLLPLLFFIRLNFRGLIILAIAFFIGKIMMEVIGDYLFLLDGSTSLGDKISTYATSDAYSIQGGELNFFLVRIFPSIFYALVPLFILKSKYPNCPIIRFEPLIMLGVLFVIIRMNVEIAYRYIDYFSIYFALLYAEFFVFIIKKSHKLSLEVAYLKAMIFFIPLFMIVIGYTYFYHKGQGFRYYPYSSVIDREISLRREKGYTDLNPRRHPIANRNEY